MALSKKGIDKLEKIMLANAKYYDQWVFGERRECGTFMCAAGFAYLLEIGAERFAKQAPAENRDASARFITACISSGHKLLGFPVYRPGGMAQVFEYPWQWPADIQEKFRSIKTPVAHVRFYIEMLRTRVNDDGSIREA